MLMFDEQNQNRIVQSPKPPPTRINGWSVRSLALTPRVINVAKRRALRRQLNDIDEKLHKSTSGVDPAHLETQDEVAGCSGTASTIFGVSAITCLKIPCQMTE